MSEKYGCKVSAGVCVAKREEERKRAKDKKRKRGREEERERGRETRYGAKEGKERMQRAVVTIFYHCQSDPILWNDTTGTTTLYFKD
jgi:hypothetical protein